MTSSAPGPFAAWPLRAGVVAPAILTLVIAGGTLFTLPPGPLCDEGMVLFMWTWLHTIWIVGALAGLSMIVGSRGMFEEPEHAREVGAQLEVIGPLGLRVGGGLGIEHELVARTKRRGPTELRIVDPHEHRRPPEAEM